MYVDRYRRTRTWLHVVKLSSIPLWQRWKPTMRKRLKISLRWQKTIWMEKLRSTNRFVHSIFASSISSHHFEQILNRLQAARASFDAPVLPTSGSSSSASLMHTSAPRQPSIYERELEAPRLTPIPLLQPVPHVFDSTPMRPVSVAVGNLIGGGYKREGRGSVFGMFW